MSSLLLSTTVRRLLLDRIEAMIYSWTVSLDLTNAGMYKHTLLPFHIWMLLKLVSCSYV